MNDIIEKHHSSSCHQAYCAGNKQHCRLWLIFAQAWWPRAFPCTHNAYVGLAIYGKPVYGKPHQGEGTSTAYCWTMRTWASPADALVRLLVLLPADL